MLIYENAFCKTKQEEEFLYIATHISAEFEEVLKH